MSRQARNDKAISKAEKLQRAGKFTQAETIYRQVLDGNPEHAEALRLLSLLEKQNGNYEQACKLILQAIKLKPENVEALFILGVIKLDQNRPEEAVEVFKTGLSIAPDNFSCLVNLGNALVTANHFEEAIRQSNLALDIDPNNVEALSNLGKALSKMGRLTDAMSTLRRTVLLRPNDGRLLNNLGFVEQEIGLIEVADKTYKQALKIDPHCKLAERNLIINILNLPNQTSKNLFETHCKYGENYRQSNIGEDKFSTRNKNINRRLRVGYLSSDFRSHPVGFNLLPLIRNHDKRTVEIFVYNLDEKLDEISKEFKTYSDHWRVINNKNDNQVAKTIEEDEIDILISLAGRFNSNQPTVATFRAAPVQVSFHDCATSGLTEMDFWLTDEFLHPEDTVESFTEQLHRIPVFYQYDPPEDFPTISILPATKNGFITFGCFNKPQKINGHVIALWSKVLAAIPHSKLFLKYGSYFNDPTLVQYWQNKFAHFGINEERLIFSGMSKSREKHLELYQNIDIALDPFPFNGATTTFEALAMGVPTITLEGQHFVGRVGVSLLGAVQLNNFVAQTESSYIDIAKDLTSNLKTLEKLRYGLRDKLYNSPLCKGKPYAESVEIAYRTMWQDWCSK